MSHNQASDSDSPLTTVAELDPNQTPGDDAYVIIEGVFGRGSIESDDVDGVDGNDDTESHDFASESDAVGCADPTEPPRRHRHFPHVQIKTDLEIGRHFAFHSHLREDGDPVLGDPCRQRCEMKVFNGSPDSLKARAGETFLYEWKFQITEGMAVSKNFTHLFQLKAKGGSNSNAPLLTISGERIHNRNYLLLIHRYSNDSPECILDMSDWEAAQGRWLIAQCRVNYGESGSLNMKVTRPGGTVLQSNADHIALWRDGAEYVRPKWGIYRSLKTRELLRSDEEIVRFAELKISKFVSPPPPFPDGPEQSGDG